MSRPGEASPTWRSSSTCSPGGSLAGAYPVRCAAIWRSMRLSRRSTIAHLLAMSGSSITVIAACSLSSTGRRNTAPKGVAMTTRRRRSERAGRAKLRSPGRPSVRRHEKQRRFWAAIATGHSSEDAAVSAGGSPAVGPRWFREAGGMAASHLTPSAPPLSGRYLSFTEREQIALSRVQGHGVREIARRLARAPSTISPELRRNAATRSGGLEYRATTAQWHADRAARRPKPAKLATNTELPRYAQGRVARAVLAPSGATVPRCQRPPYSEPPGSGKLSHPGSPIVSQAGSPILSHPGSAIGSHHPVDRDRIPSSFSPPPEIFWRAHQLQEVTSGGTEESGDRHP